MDGQSPKRAKNRYYYRTKYGMELLSFEENEIGDRFFRELDVNEELPQGVRVFRDESGNIVEFEDEIVEQIEGPTIYTPRNPPSSTRSLEA